ncbi:MAG: phytase [Anaerolineae bacterium]|nr:phytase [Anaerolineae bacterium]
MFKRLLLACLLLGLGTASARDIPTITPTAETAPSLGDGASGVAIWLHPNDLSQSLILGADDNAGLGIYDLSGALLSFRTEDGPISAVDVRYNFPKDGQAIIAASVADAPRVMLYSIDPASRELIVLGSVQTNIRLQGVCLYRSPLTSILYAIAISEFGQLEQYAIREDDGEIQAELKRAIDVGGEIEACTVDDSLRRLYISEGDNLVWRYGAEPEDAIRRRIVDYVGGNISEEMEGLAVLALEGNKGYLIITNEKSDSFLLYERAGDNAFVGEFKLGRGEGIDALSEPTSVTVTNLPLNEQYPQGLFISSDDVNTQPTANNNYKLASWADVIVALNLTVDIVTDPRQAGRAVAVSRTPAVTVTAVLETEPVAAETDAADDPAIWIHPSDTALSTIIGTDKRNGLVVYNLDGSILQEVTIGRVNNVDLRYNFPLGDERVALVGATNRTDSSLVLYAVDPATRTLRDVADQPIISSVEEVYGFCMYVSPRDGAYYAFINSADTGEVEQYLLKPTERGTVSAEVVRTFVVGSQTEGCAVDDELGVLYIGEEAVGIWRYGAEPGDSEERRLVDGTGDASNLTADVEGVAIYYGSNGSGYLIVSSQGSDEFALYERGGDNAFIGLFRVIESETADAVSGTDGLDVTNFPLGEAFPGGLLVVQDDLNLNPRAAQNFKLVDWRVVAEAFGLVVDTNFDPRAIGR